LVRLCSFVRSFGRSVGRSVVGRSVDSFVRSFVRWLCVRTCDVMCVRVCVYWVSRGRVCFCLFWVVFACGVVCLFALCVCVCVCLFVWFVCVCVLLLLGFCVCASTLLRCLDRVALQPVAVWTAAFVRSCCCDEKLCAWLCLLVHLVVWVVFDRQHVALNEDGQNASPPHAPTKLKLDCHNTTPTEVCRHQR